MNELSTYEHFLASFRNWSDAVARFNADMHDVVQDGKPRDDLRISTDRAELLRLLDVFIDKAKPNAR